VRPAQHVTTGNIQVVRQQQGHGHGRERLGDSATGRVDALDRGGQPGGQVGHLVAGLEHTARNLARVAAVIVQARIGGLLRPDHVLHREPDVDQVPVRGDVHMLQVMQQGRAVVPRHAR